LQCYGLGGLCQRAAGASWPLGTWAVNILGSFLFGAIWIMSEHRGLLSAEARTVLLIGFMGAFTTFSTLSFETVQMIRDGQWLLATANAGGQVVVGVVAVLLGMAAGRLV
jgi:CrcB protein